MSMAGRLRNLLFRDYLIIKGRTMKVDSTVDVTVDVMMVDEAGLVLMCKGETIPTDGSAGYAPGCLWFDSNGSAGVYSNVSTSTSSNFDTTV